MSSFSRQRRRKKKHADFGTRLRRRWRLILNATTTTKYGEYYYEKWICEPNAACTTQKKKKHPQHIIIRERWGQENVRKKDLRSVTILVLMILFMCAWSAKMWANLCEEARQANKIKKKTHQQVVETMPLEKLFPRRTDAVILAVLHHMNCIRCACFLQCSIRWHLFLCS